MGGFIYANENTTLIGDYSKKYHLVSGGKLLPYRQN